MELNINKNNISLSKIAVDGFSEEKVDFDIIIPEYCAPAGKILKCDISPVITSKSIETDKIVIQGICFVTVVYADENTGSIRSMSESTEFTQSYPLKESLDNYKIQLKLKPTNVVCRLQNSRRINIKAMIGIAVKVLGNYEHSLITDFDNDDIETMFRCEKYTAYINSGSSELHIAGELETRNSVLEIIKNNCTANVTDIKVIKDKAIVKGECKVCLLYTYGEEVSDVNTDCTVIPFSDVIDIEGAEEGQFCDCSCELISVRCNAGNTSDQNIITVEIDANICASVYRNSEINVLSDLYSKSYELSETTESVSFESLEKILKFSSLTRENMDVDISDAVIDEVYAKAAIKNVTYADSSLIIEGDMVVSASLHNDQEYKMYEKTYQFKVSEPLVLDFTKLRCEANVVCSDVDFSIPTDTNLDFECELIFKILAFAKKTINVINNVEVDSLKENPTNSKIILYYAEKGEKLWDIAKKYCSSVDVLKRDNDIENDFLEQNSMLLITDK